MIALVWQETEWPSVWRNLLNTVRDVLTSSVNLPSLVICFCFPILLNDKSGETPAQVAQRKQQENSSPTLLDDKSCETPAQAAQRKQLENVLYYLLNDNTNDEDVSSDGDGNVHVSTSAGMFFKAIRY